MVVGRLAGEHHVQVTTFQAFQAQHVPHFPVRQRFERLVDQSILLPPRDPRRWTSCGTKRAHTKSTVAMIPEHTSCLNFPARADSVHTISPSTGLLHKYSYNKSSFLHPSTVIVSVANSTVPVLSTSCVVQNNFKAPTY